MNWRFMHDNKQIQHITETIYINRYMYFNYLKHFTDDLVPEDIKSRIASKQNRRHKIHELLLHYKTDTDKK